MSINRAPVAKGEISRRGKTIYSLMRKKMEAERWGEVIVIDIHSGDYEVGPDDLTATLRMFERRPHAMTWGTRIGIGWIYQMSPRMTLEYYQAHGYPDE